MCNSIENTLEVTFKDIQLAVLLHKLKKATGPDGIVAEHLIYGPML